MASDPIDGLSGPNTPIARTTHEVQGNTMDCRAAKTELTGAEMEAAEHIHSKVLSWLKIRYLAVTILLAVLAPVLGFLVGLLLENTLLRNSAQEALAETKSEIKEAIKEAQSASKSARDDLVEVRATRQALDFVLAGTKTGDLMNIVERVKHAEATAITLNKQLDGIDGQLNKDKPDVTALYKAARDLDNLRKTVNDLSNLFETKEELQAIAGAFYKVYDFQIDPLEIVVLFPDSTTKTEIDQVFAPPKPEPTAAPAPATDPASQLPTPNASNPATVIIPVTADITLKSNKGGQSAQILKWENVPLTVEQSTMKHTGHDDSAGDAGKVRISGKSFAEFAVSIKGVLDDQPQWWKYDKTKAAEFKQVSISTVESFDYIDVAFKETNDQDKALIRLLERCKFPFGERNLVPRKMSLKARVNGIVFQLIENNDNIAVEPYLGNLQSADDKLVHFVFGDSRVFAGAAKKYRNGLVEQTK